MILWLMRGSDKCGMDVLWHLQKTIGRLWPQQTIPGDYIVPPSHLIYFCPMPTNARGCEKLVFVCCLQRNLSISYLIHRHLSCTTDDTNLQRRLILRGMSVSTGHMHLETEKRSSPDGQKQFSIFTSVTQSWLYGIFASQFSICAACCIWRQLRIKSQQEISQQLQEQREKVLNYHVSFSQFRVKQHSQKEKTTLVHFIFCAERIFVSWCLNLVLISDSFYWKKPNHRQIYIRLSNILIYIRLSNILKWTDEKNVIYSCPFMSVFVILRNRDEKLKNINAF